MTRRKRSPRYAGALYQRPSPLSVHCQMCHATPHRRHRAPMTAATSPATNVTSGANAVIKCRPVADEIKVHDPLISHATIAAMIDATRGNAVVTNNGTRGNGVMTSRANKVSVAGTNSVSSNATRATKANGVEINSGTKGNVGTINATNAHRNRRANRSTSTRS